MDGCDTTYWRSVNCTDGALWTNETYSFTTEEYVKFYSSASDGYIYSSGDVYKTVRENSVGKIADTSSSFFIGRIYQIASPYYVIYRSFVFFDTSTIPDDATIVSATLVLDGVTDHSETDFSVTIQAGKSADIPHDPLIVYDYYYDNYTGDGGSLGTSTWSSGWNLIYFNATGLTWISKTGTTKLCLRSSKDIGGAAAPTNFEYVSFTSSESGDVILRVTYTT